MSDQKRQPFTRRPFFLKSEEVRQTLLKVIANLPLDDVKPLHIVIEEKAKQRGLDANGYYWLRLGEIANQAWLSGRQFNSDCWHEYAKRMLMPEEVTLKDGSVCSKWVELPDGTLTVISTTQLERKCFSEYTTIVEVFGAELGCQYSENPRGR